MSEPKVELLLGSDIGAWALTRVDPRHVARVVTCDDGIADRARSLGVAVESGDVNELAASGATIGFSVHYPRILNEATLGRYDVAYNLHPGLLPWGRGWYPVFWALWDQTPAGATLHEMTPKLDRGPIVDQINVVYTNADTGGSLLNRVRHAERELFDRYWPAFASGDRPAAHAPPGHGGSYHDKADFDAARDPKRWKELSAEQLVRLARALTTDGYPGYTIECDGARFEIKLDAIDPIPNPQSA